MLIVALICYPLTAAPPKALDEDEVAFLEGVAAHEKAVEKRKAEEEAKELAAFGEPRAHRCDTRWWALGCNVGTCLCVAAAAARASQVKSAPVSVVARVELGGPATEKKSAFPEVKLKVKRKGEKGGAKEGVKKAKKEDGGAKKGDGEAKAKQEGEKKPAAAAPAMASLVAYGSDDDDEEEEE